jgi:ribosomal protein S18 acetylase RimI-like enzyme
MTSLRPMREDEFDAFRDRSREGYAVDLEVNGGLRRDVARRKAERDFERLLGAGLEAPGQSVYVVEEAGERAGVLWLAERESDSGPSVYVYAIEIDERLRGQGLGRAAMLLAEAEARRRGIARIELNVFAGNEVARSLYRSLGYRDMAVYMGKDL